MNLPDRKYAKVKARIQRLGLVIPGTIRTIYLRCGRDICKCCRSEADRHGPYYFWDRKVGGKLTSKSLPEYHLRTFEQWIENRKQLEQTIQTLLELGQQTASEVAFKTRRGNSKKPIPSKRGK